MVDVVWIVTFRHNDQLAKEAVRFDALKLFFLIFVAQWEMNLRL